MSAVNAVALLSAAGGGDYQISRSVRLRASASGYLNNASTRTVAPGAFTFSIWFKRGSLSTAQTLFQCADAGGASNKYGALALYADDTLRWGHWTGADADTAKTNGVLRDPSAWYHAVFSKPAGGVGTLYLNGVAQTKQTTYSNDTDIFATTRFIGRQYDGIRYFDGCIAEVHAIDGQALTPSSFGETDAATGAWKPKRYAGTYGAGGYYLNFSDNSAATAAAIGKDWSGNGNNWTPNNISVTAGVTYDSMTDVPTLYADGGNGRGNYATWNAVTKSPNLALTAGNLNTTYASTSNESVGATMGVTSGKWYWESTATNVVGSFPILGIAKANEAGLRSISGYYPGYSASSWGLYCNTGGFINNNSTLATYSTVSTNDVLMFALDMDTGKYWMGKNGTWFNSGVPASGAGSILSSGLTGETIFPMVAEYLASSSAANFGQRPFAYTPPTGFKALNTQNIAAGSITTSGTFTGNASADGPFVRINGVPIAMTINGNAVTFGTHADKTAGGFKLRTSSASYNASGSNTYSITTTGAKFKYANAQGNP